MSNIGDDAFDHDHLTSLLNMDDIFADIVSSLEHTPDQDFTTCEDTPNHLFPDQSRMGFVPVSPSTSCNGLSESAVVEPTILAEMSPARVSPTIEGIEKPNSKKRKRAISDSSSEADGGEIQQARRERNREHAKRSRQRKKSLTGDLQEALKDLKEENAKLREQIHSIFGQKKTESLVSARLGSSTENFIQALKKPENRVVDSSTQQFLQRLRKTIPTHFNGPA